jgi:hypothetical protein
MMRSTKLHILLANTSALVVALFTWTAATAYVPCCHWPSHKETYTFDLSMPSSFYPAINAGALTWTTSPASTWAWINSSTPGRVLKYMSIDGPNGTLADTTKSWNPSTLVMVAMSMRYDSGENWYTGTGTPGSGQYDLQSVATHEFGHGLSLEHTNAACPNDSTNPTMCASYNGTAMRTLEADDTAGLQFLYPPLVQLFWRGSAGYSRQVAIVNGTPDFNQAQSWTTPPSSGGNPGSGDVQAWASVVINTTLHQEMWQGNTRWRRTVPITGGIEQWTGATAWVSGLGNFGTQPGSGDTQANNAYRICNTLYQGYWRGDQGFSRTIPIVNNLPDWNNVGSWQGPVTLNSLGAGTGSLQALSIYPISSTQMRQGIWRNNYGYSRTIPIVSCALDWNNATAWSAAVPIGNLGIGSGDMRAQDNYALTQ